MAELPPASFGLRKPDTAKAKPGPAASPLALQTEWDVEALSETGDRSFGLAFRPGAAAGPPGLLRRAEPLANAPSRHQSVHALSVHVDREGNCLQ